MTLKAPQSWPWTAVAIAGGIVALVLGVLGTDPFGPASVLGAAALLGAGGPAAGVTALIALTVALGTPPEALTDTSPVVAGVASLALAVLLRAVDPALSWQIRQRPLVAGVWLCLLAIAALLLPDATAWLADPNGAPLVAQAVVNDASNGVQRSVGAAAIVPHAVPLADFRGWLMAALIASAFVVLSLRVGGRSTRPGWFMVAASGVLLAVFGGLGLVELFGGAVEVDTVALAHRWNLDATGYANVASVQVPTANALALWSRPIVDPLRVLLGVLVVLTALAALRSKQASDTASAGAEQPLGPRPLVLLALGLGVVAALAVPSPMTPALLGGALVVAGALVAGRYGRPTGVAPDLLLAGAGLIWVLAWVFPAAGWILV